MIKKSQFHISDFAICASFYENPHRMAQILMCKVAGRPHIQMCFKYIMKFAHMAITSIPKPPILTDYITTKKKSRQLAAVAKKKSKVVIFPAARVGRKKNIEADQTL